MDRRVNEGIGQSGEGRPRSALALLLGPAVFGQVVVLAPRPAITGPPFDGDEAGLFEAGQQGVQGATLDRPEAGLLECG